MTNDNLLPFCFPAVDRKKITAAFDGGRITSDGGVMLLAQAERRLGIADQLARVMPDKRDADRVVHRVPEILRARAHQPCGPSLSSSGHGAGSHVARARQLRGATKSWYSG